jgi:hypothetical protein
MEPEFVTVEVRFYVRKIFKPKNLKKTGVFSAASLKLEEVQKT